MDDAIRLEFPIFSKKIIRITNRIRNSSGAVQSNRTGQVTTNQPNHKAATETGLIAIGDIRRTS